MKNYLILIICALSFNLDAQTYTSLQLQGSGSPEAVVTAPVGSTYQRSDGGNNTVLYIKETGAGNTGWVAVSKGVLRDADNDTKVDVEESADEDIIRFDVLGVEQMQLNSAGELGIGAAPTASFDLSIADGLRLTGRASFRGAGSTLSTAASRLQFFNTTSSGEFNFLLPDSDTFSLYNPLGTKTQSWSSTGSRFTSHLNATSTETLSLLHYKSTPLDDDYQSVTAYGMDSAGDTTAYSEIRFVSENVTNTTEDGRMNFMIADNGTLTNAMSLKTAGNIIGSSTITTTVGGRLLGSYPTVASATNVTLGEANCFAVTGTTTINTLVTTGWTAGSKIELHFSTSLTVNDNDTSSGNIKLAGSADFSATSDDILSLTYDGTDWRESSRSAN